MSLDLAQIEHQMNEMVSFDTKIPIDEFVAEHERKLKEAKKQKQIEFCGSWAARLNPANGGLINYQWYCGYWRECPVCFGRRVAQVTARVKRAEEETLELGIVEMSEDLAKKFTRHLRKIDEDYLRYPISSLSSIVFFDQGSVLEKGGWVPDSELTMEDIDFSMLANTPKGKRWSGSLGKKVEKEVDDSGVQIVVSVKEIITDGISWEDKRATWEDAVEETSYLDPGFDSEELSFAAWKRMKVWREYIEEKGGRIVVERSVRVTLSDSLYTGWGSVDVIRQDSSPPATIADGNVELTSRMRQQLSELGISAEQLELIAA